MRILSQADSTIVQNLVALQDGCTTLHPDTAPQEEGDVIADSVAENPGATVSDAQSAAVIAAQIGSTAGNDEAIERGRNCKKLPSGHWGRLATREPWSRSTGLACSSWR